jgi:hypothetical protein
MLLCGAGLQTCGRDAETFPHNAASQRVLGNEVECGG